MKSGVRGLRCCVNFPVPSLQCITGNSNSVTGMQAQVLLLDQERGASQTTQKNPSNRIAPNQERTDQMQPVNADHKMIMRC